MTSIVKYEDKVNMVTAGLLRKTAMSHSDICHFLGRSPGGSLLKKILDEHSVERTIYTNVTLYYLPNTPQEEVDKVWQEQYKPYQTPSRLKTMRKNDAEKRRRMKIDITQP